MPSIEDVARMAGVSIATVSRALRGLPDVRPLTRQKVLAAAEQLNYVASPFAARLASGRTSTVGVIVPFVRRWYFGEVIDAVEHTVRGRGYDLLLFNLGDAAGRARVFDPGALRKRVDAILVAALLLSDAEFETLVALDKPIGLLGTQRPGVLSTRIDDVAGARSAVEHLLALGHRRIGLIGGDTDDPMRFTPPQQRLRGYRQALAYAGVPVDPAYEVLGYFTLDGGTAAAQRLLDLPQRPTAIFAESDEMAFGALRAIRRAGLRVPQDVAVIGFDDHAHAPLMDLSTVRQPVGDLAIDIAGRLLTCIGAEPGEPVDVVLPTELVVRGSTDPAHSLY